MLERSLPFWTTFRRRNTYSDCTGCVAGRSALKEVLPEPLTCTEIFHLNHVYRLQVHLRRTANLLFSIDVRLFSEHLSNIKQDYLQHLLSQAAWIYFASYNSSMHRYKLANIEDTEGCRTNLQEQILWLCKLLHVMLPPGAVLPAHSTPRLRIPQSFGCKLSSFHVYKRFSPGSLGMFDIRFVYPECAVLSPPGASQSTVSIDSENDGPFR